MKKIIFLIALAMLLNWQMAYGQNRKESNIYVVYIAHESTTPVNKLCNTIKELRTDAMETNGGLLVYLANGHYPMLSVTGIPGFSNEVSGEEAFDNIISALQELPSHDVSPGEDVTQFTELMARCNLLDNQQNLLYKSATLDFYVGSTFWGLRNNELILSRLYSALDIPKVQEKDELYFNVYKPANTTLDYPEGQPFGIKNAQGINKKLKIIEF